MSNVPEVWTPKPFSGSDLLPTAVRPQEVNPYADEVVVADKATEASDMQIPILKVLQGISDEVVKHQLPPGVMFLSGRDEIIKPPIRTVIVFHSKSRALFPQPNRPETNGLERCISPNGITGSVYGDCETCQHKEWPRDERGKTPEGQSPPCSLSNNFVVLTPYGPAVIRYARTSFKAGKDFVGAVLQSGLNFWHHPVVIDVEQDNKALGSSGKKASYFKLTIDWDKSEIVAGPTREAVKDLWKQVSAAWEKGTMTHTGSDE